MGLRELAESDLGAILEDGAVGAGWPILLTDPAGTVAPLTGYSNDIAALIDPDTGQPVSGRSVSVALRLSSIAAAVPLAGTPRGISDTVGRPWLVTFDDLTGKAHTFKVAQSYPDRALGLVTLMLEVYRG